MLDLSPDLGRAFSFKAFWFSEIIFPSITESHQSSKALKQLQNITNKNCVCFVPHVMGRQLSGKCHSLNSPENMCQKSRESSRCFFGNCPMGLCDPSDQLWLSPSLFIFTVVS
ncbi:hypothetical protein GOODEAATRI_007883 [Goodea atripinnis]|uniref:Uncharacterized protein n=1 Tax=Goodea atripinnis TaxID=208336 RepID=A0ABV0NSM8_9TELE